MILNFTRENLCPTAAEYRWQWAKKLLADIRPRTEVGERCQGNRELPAIVDFLYSLPGEGPPKVVIQKFAQTKAVYIVDTTRHVHTLCLHKKEEASSILLTTHFGIVDEVRIHNFHLYHYLIADRVHVRIAQSHWKAVQFVLSCIQRRPGVEFEGGRKDPIKITFDEFLHLAVATWKEGKPYAKIVCDLPLSDTRSIISLISITAKHPSLSYFTRGYYESDFEGEIEIENDNYEER